MRKAIRSFLIKRGYDIVKIDKPLKVYNGASKINNYTYHPTPIGNYYLPNNVENDVIARHMKAGIFFEPEVVNLAKEFIKPNTSVLDIGSNFGQMSIEYAKLVGENGKVYSFEAQKKVYDVLEQNVKANGLNNITCIYGAVYKECGKLMIFPEPDFTMFGSFGSFGLAGKTNNGIEVKSITIDSLNILDPICFMKVDVQGSDLFAMQGAVETIKRNKMPILFEFEQQFQKDFGTNFQQYVEFVESINYKFERTIMDINFLIVPKD